jgi:cytochrome c biogenesis protein CcdA
VNDAFPAGIALVAGGLATLNPCAFPLLPAFLSLYVGADDQQLPRAPNRIAQGLLVGLLVVGGFLGVFAVVGLPVAYGVTVVADAVPWMGMAVGLGLLTLGGLELAGRRIGVAVANPVRPDHDRRLRTMLVFGAGYGIASLGCTLPVFLTLLASAAGTGGAAGSVAVFAAFGSGMALVLMALGVAAALLDQGLTRGLRRLLPHMHRIAAGLLIIAGAYLTYYWARVHLGPAATLASDPLVGLVTKFTARLMLLTSSAGLLIVAGAALVVVTAVTVTWLRARRQRTGTGAGTFAQEGSSRER